MRVPVSWLRHYCDPDLDVGALAERLSMTGTEVERIGHAGAPSGAGFVIARVDAVDAHPDADRLSVCAVDAGEGEPRTIVCGAPNVAAGQAVAVALPGAVMPDGTELGEAKLRGVTSSGMILSEAEMELGEDADGIAVLDTELEPGTPLAEHVAISEPVLELEITPNRPDCLSVYGVAREVHAITAAPLAEAPWERDAEPTGEVPVDGLASVRVEVPELCPRFTARAFTDVKIGPSPLWLKARLIAAGQRPINNVVDITNYVMLLTGQPLHAFDLDRVPGGELIVRAAAEGERMTTLDGVERTFVSDAVLVCDRERPSGIAGIMGGQESEVSDETTSVLLEAATWNSRNILATSNRLGLRSEASSRFEKGLHPDLAMRGQRLASTLLVELCGAKLAPGTIDVAAPGHEPFSVPVSLARVEGWLGMEIPGPLCVEYLERLGFEATLDGDRLDAGVPPDRYFDVTRDVDVIEELARVHGLDEHLPATLPPRPPGAGGLAPHQRLLRRVADVLRDAGLDEVVTWTFVAPGADERLGVEAGAAPIRLHNPLSEDQSAMRTALLGGLLTSAAHNLARGAEGVALFESGRAYLPEPPPADGGVLDGRFGGDRPAPAHEPHRIGALLSGATGGGWRSPEREPDFYDAKGLVELLSAASGVDVVFEPVELPYLHPGRAAAVAIAGRRCGWVGELHPAIAARHDLPGGAGFEIDAAPLLDAGDAGRERFVDVTTYPAVLEDIAVVADAGMPAETIRAAVLAGGGELLAAAEVFDVYSGEQVGAGRRSVALRLEFRAPDRTLTDAEVGHRRAEIVARLEAIGAELRG